MWAAFASEAAPLLAAGTRRSPLTPARRWVLAWTGLYVVMNTIGVIFAARHVNNHFLTYVFTPLQGATILWALSLWQTRQIATLTMRIAIPFFVIAWAVLTLTVEDYGNFSKAAEPVYSMLALAAVLYTLVARSGDAVEPLMHLDWFWICIGLALHFGSLAVLLPLAAGLLYKVENIVVKAYIVRSWLEVVAFLCIAYGFLCPVPTTRSGASSSPAS
jgi:hypothetical protein